MLILILAICAYAGVEFKTINNKYTAIFTDNETTISVENDIIVDSIYYDRNIQVGAIQTVMFPFSTPSWQIGDGLNVYEYADVKKDCETCNWRIELKKYADYMKANTPYVIINYSGNTKFNFKSGNGITYTINTTTNNSNVEIIDADNNYIWNFIGTYEYVSFKNKCSTYGFAAKQVGGANIGSFVKVNCTDESNAYIKPMRSYLRLKRYEPSVKRALAKEANIDTNVTINSIDVYIVDDLGEPVFIGKIKVEEIDLPKVKYDLNGRIRQDNAKGMYIKR